ncbi:hypothetical protein G4B88_012593 [Cannabis sativa]|uniref:DUF4283 domain-containing protein n=1 Tax=Cannabis sativa TaxID=3483 RepID=A0A7J6ECG8_CANSA|nr:hypothetical protein G4B88_012593 [Cannabis sativa]
MAIRLFDKEIVNSVSLEETVKEVENFSLDDFSLDLAANCDAAQATIASSVVGRFFSKEMVSNGLLRKVLTRMWKLKGGWRFQLVERKTRTFVFRFHFEKEAKFVLDSQPWNPCKGFMLVTPISMIGKWAYADLTSFSIWVRVMDVPTKFLNNDVVVSVANRVGTFIQANKVRVHSSGGGGKEGLSYLKYDKLPSLCYKCDVIGHEDSGCSRRKRMVILDDGRSISLYGPQLKEGSRIENSFGLLDKEDIQERKRLEEEEADNEAVEEEAEVTQTYCPIGVGVVIQNSYNNFSVRMNDYAKAPKERAHTENVAQMAKIFKNAFGDTIFGSTEGSILKGSKGKAKIGRTNLNGPESDMTHGGESRDLGNNFEVQEEGGAQECGKRPCVGDTGMRNDIELQTVKMSLRTSGGIELFWKQGWQVEILRAERNQIKVLFGANGPYPPWIGAFIYAPPHREDRVKNLPIWSLNHSPAIVDTQMDSEAIKAPFRFIDVWTMDPSCKKTIEDAWTINVRGVRSFVLNCKLQNTRKAL